MQGEARTDGRILMQTSPLNDSISLIAVVHNEAPRIEAFIRQTAPLVDQIVLVDQASTDGTLGLALEAWYRTGVTHKLLRTVHEPCRGFSEASNPLALSYCTSEWVFVLFPDETLTEDFIESLPLLVANPAFDAYRLKRDSSIDGHVFLNDELTMRLVRRRFITLEPTVHSDPGSTSSKICDLPYTAIVHAKTHAEQESDNARYASLGITAGIAPL
jgi:hypothetical protein